jgi:hypothetical protein
MKQRQQVGCRICLTEQLEHFLAATHPGEPVVYQNDFQDNTSP